MDEFFDWRMRPLAYLIVVLGTSCIAVSLAIEESQTNQILRTLGLVFLCSFILLGTNHFRRIKLDFCGLSLVNVPPAEDAKKVPIWTVTWQEKAEWRITSDEIIVTGESGQTYRLRRRGLLGEWKEFDRLRTLVAQSGGIRGTVLQVVADRIAAT